MFQVFFQEIANVKSGITQQVGAVNNLNSVVKGYVPKVQAVWVGQDATQFGVEVMTRLIPAMTELALAIAGINVNLTKGEEIVNQADQNCSSIVGNLAGEFGGI